MDVKAHYRALRNNFNQPEGIFQNVRMDEIAHVLDCTIRNAQLLIKKLVELQYIEWIPGKGRGNQSKICFIKPLEELKFEKAKELVKQGKISAALQMMNEELPIAYSFEEWLYSHFGARPEEQADIIRYPFYRPVLRLDPAFVHRRTEADFIRQIFNTLTSFNERTKQLEGELAHYWESKNDHKVWVFYLRKGVKFHHGKLFTGEDVKFTFTRLKSLGTAAPLLNMIEHIEGSGSYGIEFHLKESNILFPHELCAEYCSIVPSDLDELIENRDFQSHPIGTGPFRIVENNESIMKLHSHQEYFNGRPHLDGMEMWVVPDYNQSRVLDQLNQGDILYDGEAKREHKTFNELTGIETGAVYLSMNLRKKGVLQDPFVRKAIDMAINRSKMIGDLKEMREIPASSFFPDISSEEIREEGDLLLARKLLQQSSYRGEMLSLYTYEMTSNEKNVQWLRGQLEIAGFHIETIILPVTQLTNPEILQKADLLAAGEVAGAQPDIELIHMFQSENGFIQNHLDDASKEMVSECIRVCRMESSFEKRKELLHKLELKLAEKRQVLFLFHIKQRVMHDGSIGGAIMNARGKIDYRKVWLRK
ncbi:ABC transporter substrate-binding protein [Falsibacillus pallidus]|uniref:MarR-like DNA-binding transcriptional regulator SgrR of sgrS sRNA n=1 Tax=Falsibacillus pallidus TaxID=493781 RepID=A0A370GPY3_9BACI|nr:ABC transporter substrate-binding protein [Falsibacillus pallidus]RDI45439.1 MarR-like DNA-binding transcriptional regulator SgrR of sgrS sRNA [Falsibacillus pallidus]